MNTVLTRAYRDRTARREAPRTASSGQDAAANAFEPPTPPAVSVSRRRLTALLDLAMNQRLTFVVAPPGYGKTVLLAQWASSISRGRIRWLTLTAEDDEPEVFVRHLLAAITSPDLTIHRSGVKRRSGVHANSGYDALAPGLPIELDWLPPTTLIIDDFDALSSPVLLDDFATFAERAPHSLRIVLSTRVDPPLRFYRLSFSAAPIELRQHDLAFTVDEARELLCGIADQDISADAALRLVARTEGWVAALQLAGLSLVGRADADAFVGEFVRDDHVVAEHLTEEVLRRQPADVREFLVATSVLHRMTGGLCDHILGRDNSTATLEDLERRSLFISPVDDGREWFRYHQLFRSLLRHQLRDQAPDLERSLLRRAADWYLRRNDAETAVRYLTEAESWEQVLDAAMACGRDQLEHGRAVAVANWIDAVPPPVRGASVPVELVHAAGFALGGRPARARQLLDGIHASRAGSPSERVVADLLHACVSLQEGSLPDAATAARSVLDKVGDLTDAHVIDVFGLTRDVTNIAMGAHAIYGASLVYEGRWAEARTCFAAAPRRGHAFWELTMLGALALLHAWSGELAVADRVATRALSLAGDYRFAQDRGLIDARLALVCVARRRNSLDRAAELLDDLRRCTRHGVSELTQTFIALEEARVALADNRPEAGLTVLAGTRPRQSSLIPEAVLARRRAVEAQLLLATGDMDAALEALALAPLDTVEVTATRVRIDVERGDLEAADGHIAAWPTEPSPVAALERDVWTAIVERLHGDDTGARSRLATVVGRAEWEHDVGLFHSPPVVRAARNLYRLAPSPFLREILELPVSTRRERPVTNLVEQLTDREIIVLSLLPTRMSNVEMAATLGVSVNTIKTHLKHIYRKLVVEERADAVATGERLGLI